MPKFLLVLDTDRFEHTLPSFRRVIEIAKENNERVDLARTDTGALLAILCENEPRAIEGCKWVKEE